MYRYRSLLLSFFVAMIVAGYSWLNFTPAPVQTDISISSAGFSIRFGDGGGYRSYPRYSYYDRNYDYDNYYYYYPDGYVYYYSYPYSDYNYQYYTYPRYKYGDWDYRGYYPNKDRHHRYRH